jgi:hypothetical protein
MEKQIAEIPVLQKSKNPENQVTKESSSCCSKPVNGAVCCTPGKTIEENNGACCAQPEDGSACCEK